MSTALTSQGSLVRSQSRPPSIPKVQRFSGNIGPRLRPRLDRKRAQMHRSCDTQTGALTEWAHRLAPRLRRLAITGVMRDLPQEGVIGVALFCSSIQCLLV